MNLQLVLRVAASFAAPAVAEFFRLDNVESCRLLKYGRKRRLNASPEVIRIGVEGAVDDNGDDPLMSFEQSVGKRVGCLSQTYDIITPQCKCRFSNAYISNLD